MFVDRVGIHVRAGDGGAGVVSFERHRGRPKGKPTGGSGGDGGDVLVHADDSIATLLRYKRHPHHRAGNGTHGSGDQRHGRRGEDLILPVPPGTLVIDDDGIVLADLVRDGQSVTIVRGGRGGRGNASFVGPAHKSPSFSEQGEYGEERSFTLELKLVADAALIGFPNAGKSTLISRISAARPKIADYPFTTLEPHLGVVSIDEREFVVADVPGLIEGAAEGRGLGHEFLRHVERARALVVLLDPSPLQEESPADQYRVLMAELFAHLPELVERPRVVAITKRDVVADPELADQLSDELGEPEVHSVSAVTGAGLGELLHAVADAVGRAERSAPAREGFVLHRPFTGGFEVRREGEGWLVEGRSAERAVRLDDLTKPEAADLAARRLERLGVDDALREAGAQPGDEVRIGELVFEFRETDDRAEQPGEAPADRSGSSDGDATDRGRTS